MHDTEGPRGHAPDRSSLTVDVARELEGLAARGLDEAALRVEIARVVAANKGSEGAIRAWLATLLGKERAHDGSALPADAWIGPYRILGVLGEGGMGIVHLAEQKEPMMRRVALKVIRRGYESKALLGRFERERQSLAVMNHPNIAKVLDAGTTGDGRPFFAMELVRGDPITDYCDRQRLPVEERLRLFVQVCQGVQHAHHKGVVHRDLKPGNVLVEIQGEQPTARIIDFGLARVVGSAAGVTVFTEYGQVIGTPDYMSPEQAEMTGADIDARTDVYSLGVLLYELLTGTLPFPTRDARAAGPFELQRRIREEQPVVPSRRVSSSGNHAQGLAQSRGTSSVALVRRLRNDLDWIVMKCIEKDRARRYQTASELAADIQRHLAGEPVVAGRPSSFYRLRKLAWRHRVAFGVLTTVFVTMTVALVIVVQARSAEAKALTAVFDLLDLDAAEKLVARARGLTPVTIGNLDAAEHWLDEVSVLTAESPQRREEVQLAASARRATDAMRAVTQALLAADGWRSRITSQVAAARATVAAFASSPGWQAAREAIAADPRFLGTQLVPQPGLEPLGADPESGLQEFAVALTGVMPARAADGSLPLAGDAAVVLVLVPGGDVTIGAAEDDDLAAPIELPRLAVQLVPFFVAKHELTRQQWVAMTNFEQNPNAQFPNRWHEKHGPPEHMGPRSPVESISWFEADAVLRRFGLALPTEAQWEYAARGGSPHRWWTGNDRESLQSDGAAENIADAASIRARARLVGAQEWPEYDDLMPVHGLVGSLRPNGFGLFDVLGNVKELCVDAWIEHRRVGSLRAGDGAITSTPQGVRVVRGGSWFNGVRDARVTARRSIREDERFDNVGVRPVRALVR